MHNDKPQAHLHPNGGVSLDPPDHGEAIAAQDRAGKQELAGSFGSRAVVKMRSHRTVEEVLALRERASVAEAGMATASARAKLATALFEITAGVLMLLVIVAAWLASARTDLQQQLVVARELYHSSEIDAANAWVVNSRLRREKLFTPPQPCIAASPEKRAPTRKRVCADGSAPVVQSPAKEN